MLSVKETIESDPLSGFPLTHRWLHTGNCGRLPPTRGSHSRCWLNIFRKTPIVSQHSSGPYTVGRCHCTPHSFGLSNSSPSKSGFKLFFCSISTCQKKKKKGENIRNEREGEKKYENEWAQRTSEGYFVDVLGCCPNGTTNPAYAMMPSSWSFWGDSYSVSCRIAPYPVGWPSSLWTVLVSLAPLFHRPHGRGARASSFYPSCRNPVGNTKFTVSPATSFKTLG